MHHSKHQLLRVWSICYVSAVPFRVTPSGCSGRLNRTVAVTDVQYFVGLADSGQTREKSDHPVGQSWSDRAFQSQYVLAGFGITPFFILLFEIYRYSILTFFFVSLSVPTRKDHTPESRSHHSQFPSWRSALLLFILVA